VSFNRAQLQADLRGAEGQRTCVYDDATGEPIGPGSHVRGHPTIGYGHRLDVPQPHPLLEMWLDMDIDAAVTALDRELHWWRECSDAQQRALVELVFNLGAHGLLTFAHFLVYLRAGQLSAAACELANSKWAGQVGPTRAHRIISQIQVQA